MGHQTVDLTSVMRNSVLPDSPEAVYDLALSLLYSRLKEIDYSKTMIVMRCFSE